MSTNKSQNLKLHLWVPEDDFLRTEFNENFTALDSAVKAEETARKNAVTAEANARKSAVTQLQNSISSTGSTSSSAVGSLRTELTEQINAVKATADAAYCPDYKPFVTGTSMGSTQGAELNFDFVPSMVLFFCNDEVVATWPNGTSGTFAYSVWNKNKVVWYLTSMAGSYWKGNSAFYIAFR